MAMLLRIRACQKYTLENQHATVSAQQLSLETHVAHSLICFLLILPINSLIYRIIEFLVIRLLNDPFQLSLLTHVCI